MITVWDVFNWPVGNMYRWGTATRRWRRSLVRRRCQPKAPCRPHARTCYTPFASSGWRRSSWMHSCSVRGQGQDARCHICVHFSAVACWCRAGRRQSGQQAVMPDLKPHCLCTVPVPCLLKPITMMQSYQKPSRGAVPLLLSHDQRVQTLSKISLQLLLGPSLKAMQTATAGGMQARGTQA